MLTDSQFNDIIKKSLHTTLFLMPQKVINCILYWYTDTDVKIQHRTETDDGVNFTFLSIQ